MIPLLITVPFPKVRGKIYTQDIIYQPFVYIFPPTIQRYFLRTPLLASGKKDMHTCYLYSLLIFFVYRSRYGQAGIVLILQANMFWRVFLWRNKNRDKTSSRRSHFDNRFPINTLYRFGFIWTVHIFTIHFFQ